MRIATQIVVDRSHLQGARVRVQSYRGADQIEHNRREWRESPSKYGCQQAFHNKQEGKLQQVSPIGRNRSKYHRYRMLSKGSSSTTQAARWQRHCQG